MDLPSHITHLLFIDFEVTWALLHLMEEQLSVREIIEFPCVLVRRRNSDGTPAWDEVGVFHEYVRPVVHKWLSRYARAIIFALRIHAVSDVAEITKIFSIMISMRACRWRIE
jgi:inhibitor of KinA sporulation pathway (predicted exonuclease)